MQFKGVHFMGTLDKLRLTSMQNTIWKVLMNNLIYNLPNKVICRQNYHHFKKTSNDSHCIEIRIYGILELGPLLERLKRIVISMVLSPTDELWNGFESW